MSAVTFDDIREEQRVVRRRFLARVNDPARYDVLFDHLPDVYFFVKDWHGRFMRVNRAFLELVRATSEDDVIGARDSDFFPASLAEGYSRDDHQVVRLGQPMIDKAELVRNADGGIDWFCTTKLPVLDKNMRAIGVCGVTRDVKKMSDNNDRLLFWTPVLQAILDDYASPLPTAALAQKIELSASQLNRRFRKHFRTTPQAYLMSVRISAACRFLITTNLTISEIAMKTGFHDHSHFTKRFIENRGVPPSSYRARHRVRQATLRVATPAQASAPTNDG